MSANNSLGEAVLDLTADDSQMVVDLEGAKKKALAKMEQFGADMTRIGQSMTVAFTLPLIAAGGFAVEAASNLEETKNKATVVFGDMADSVIKNAERADSALGLSQQKYLDYASSIAAALKAGGMGVEESAALAERAVQHFADLASFHNAETADVAVAWQSAIHGQYEPIQKYFPFITDSYLKTYGIANGMLDENIDTLTANQRAVLINAIALDESLNPALNDFAETSDGAANQMRTLQAQSENAAATLGLQLLPYAIQFMQMLSDLITRFQALTPEQQKWVMIIGAVVAAAGPLLMVVGSLITAFTAIAGVVATVTTPMLVVVAVIAAIAAAAYLLYLAWINNWGGIQEKVAAVWAVLQPILMNLWTWLSTNIPLAIEALSNFWTGRLLPAIMAVWAWMSAVLFPFFQALGNFFGAVFNVALTAMAGIWQNVLQPALLAVMNVLAGQVMPVFQALADFWQGVLQPIVSTLADWIGGALVGAFNGLTNTLQGVSQWLNTIASALNSMTLPSWMTPGSPTPWEIGLLGVNDALKKVSGIGLPNLNSSLTMMPAPAVAGMSGLSGGGGSGTSVQFVYQPFIGVNDEYEAEQKLRGIIERIERKKANQ